MISMATLRMINQTFFNAALFPGQAIRLRKIVYLPIRRAWVSHG